MSNMYLKISETALWEEPNGFLVLAIPAAARFIYLLLTR